MGGKITTLDAPSSRSQSKKSTFKTPASQNQNASPPPLKAVSGFQESQQRFFFWEVRTASELGKTAYTPGLPEQPTICIPLPASRSLIISYIQWKTHSLTTKK